MEFFLKPSMLYTFIVLIPWCVAYIPRRLQQKRHNPIYLSIVFQLLVYGYLFRLSNPEENWAYVIFADVGLISFFILGGVVQHRANMKHRCN